MVDASLDGKKGENVILKQPSYRFESCPDYKKNKKRFGRLKNLTYLCKTNNGGRKFSDECPTPVRKRRSSLTYYIKDKVTTNPLVIGSF